MSMRKMLGTLAGALAVLSLAAFLWAADSQVDDELLAKRRLFPKIGPGLRAVKRGIEGKYYILASPSVGVAIFDADGKQLSVIGAPPELPVSGKAGRSAIAFGEDCDVDTHGNIYVADRGYNLVTLFSSDGKTLRSIPTNGPVSVVALPEDEVAVATSPLSHLVTVFGPNGKVVREFGAPESLSTRDDLNGYLSLGRLASDSQGRIYYGYTYMPEPLIRQYDRFGYAGQEFEFSGLDAYPEAQAARKAIAREEARQEPVTLRPVMTAFGVDPFNGDVWMCLHNTLVHFDKDGNRRSEYQIYAPNGARLEAVAILVEEERLLIAADPLGVYEFPRPDRKH